jgi:hypothetical protein
MIGRSRWFERDEMRSLALSVDVPQESSGEVEEERVMSGVGFGEDHRVDCLSKYESESENGMRSCCGAESSQQSVADCRVTRAVEEDMFDRVIRLGLLRLADRVCAGSRGGLVLQLTVMFSGEVATSAKASAKLTDGRRLETQKVSRTRILLAVEQRCVCFVRRVLRVTPVVVCNPHRQ